MEYMQMSTDPIYLSFIYLQEEVEDCKSLQKIWKNYFVAQEEMTILSNFSGFT